MSALGASSLRWKSLLSFNLQRDVAFLTWGMVIWSIGAGLYASFWPLIIENTGATPTQIGIVIGISGFGRLAVMLPSGIAADRFSRRFLIWGATSLGVPSALIYWLSIEWWHLIPGVALGALSAISVPSLSSYIAEASPTRDRVRSFNWVYTIGPMAPMVISPIIGGWLAGVTSLRFLFLPTAIFYGLSALTFWFITERGHPDRTNRPSPSYRDTLRLTPVRIGSMLQMLLLFVLTIGITFIPNYMQDVHKASITQIGVLGAIASVGGIILAVFVGKLPWLTPTRGIATATAMIGLICAAILLTGSFWLLALLWVLRGGFSVAWALFATVLTDTVPERMRGRSFAMAEFLGGFGFAVAPFVAGPLYGIDPKLPLLICVAATLPMIGLVLLFERRVVKPAMLAQVE
jgi:MFS family permease